MQQNSHSGAGTPIPKGERLPRSQPAGDVNLQASPEELDPFSGGQTATQTQRKQLILELPGSRQGVSFVDPSFPPRPPCSIQSRGARKSTPWILDMCGTWAPDCKSDGDCCSGGFFILVRPACPRTRTQESTAPPRIAPTVPYRNSMATQKWCAGTGPGLETEYIPEADRKLSQQGSPEMVPRMIPEWSPAGHPEWTQICIQKVCHNRPRNQPMPAAVLVKHPQTNLAHRSKNALSCINIAAFECAAHVAVGAASVPGAIAMLRARPGAGEMPLLLLVSSPLGPPACSTARAAKTFARNRHGRPATRTVRFAAFNAVFRKRRSGTPRSQWLTGGGPGRAGRAQTCVLLLLFPAFLTPRLRVFRAAGATSERRRGHASAGKPRFAAFPAPFRAHRK